MKNTKIVNGKRIALSQQEVEQLVADEVAAKVETDDREREKLINDLVRAARDKALDTIVATEKAAIQNMSLAALRAAKDRM